MNIEFKIVKRFRIKEQNLRIIQRCFLRDVTALGIADISLMNRNTATRYYKLFRVLVLEDALIDWGKTA